ncbi:Selplg [Symbiodinium sp. CCMP2592]|nr:Selplg [Symbiodinium sp. CCMP2592]
MAAVAKGDGGMNVQGLAFIWEEIAEVRNSARHNGVLMKVPAGASFCDCNRANAVANTAALMPCLERMRENDLKLPYISPLQDEVDLFFKQVHLKIPEKLAYRTAGEIKKMLSFIKRKAQKKEDHIDMYMAGLLRQQNAQRAQREATERARSNSSLGESSTGDDDDDTDNTVEGETDLDEFRRWLELPRGSAEVPASEDPSVGSGSASSVPSAGSEATSRVPSQAAGVSHAEAKASSAVPSEAKAAPPVPSQAKASSAVPSAANAAPPVPSQAKASSTVPSEAKAARPVPSQAKASSPVPSEATASTPVPSQAEASSGSGGPSSYKQSSVPELPKAPQATLNRSKVMGTGAAEPGSSKDGMSTWHVAGNCDKCLKPPDLCNLLAMI